MDTKRWLALAIAFALFLVSTAVSVFTTDFTTSMEGLFGGYGDEVNERIIEQGSATEKIAVIHLNGVIQDDIGGGGFFTTGGYNHDQFLKQLDHAANDPEVFGIVLRVNTPGGGVVESDEIHDKLVEITEDYRKKVYVSMGSMAASGGYYVSAPANKIYANSQTLTGSLGVIMQSINFSEMAEEWGVHTEVIKSGPYKDIMSSTREMEEDERAILQALVDDSYEQFVDVIEAGRDFTRDQVYELADGRIYTGSQALDRGLIDGLGYLDDVIDHLQEDLGRGKLTVVEYDSAIGFPSFIGISAKQFIPNNQLNEVQQWLQQNQGPQLMYLYTN